MSQTNHNQDLPPLPPRRPKESRINTRDCWVYRLGTSTADRSLSDFAEDEDSARLENLRSHASEGCALCEVRLLSIEKFVHPLVISEQSRVSFRYPGYVTAQCSVLANKEVNETKEISFELFTDDTEATAYLDIGQHDNSHIDLCEDTASDESFRKIENWIKLCSNNHAGCNQPRSGRNPSRLIYVKGAISSGQVWLREMDKSAGLVQYVCLSHCWGKHQPIRTLKDSVHQFITSGIQVSAFPKSFQDAILTTQKLGFDYIWIDSICIVQDDTDDWRREAADMGRIYSNSEITIAAAWAPDSTHGLFSTQSKDGFATQPIKLNHSAAIPRWLSQCSIYMRKSEIPHQLVRQDVHAFPLMDRAWVYQERVLSRRFLIFGLVEVLWQCVEKNDCFCGTGLGIIDTARANWSRLRGPSSTESITWDRAYWGGIWNAYAGLKLTFAKDIFPALAGLAREARDRHFSSSTYLAGLWSHDLPRDLLWGTPIDKNPGDYWHRAMPWRAPSWSWASLMRPSLESNVHTSMLSTTDQSPLWHKSPPRMGHDPPTIVHIAIEDVSCSPAGPDPFGELKSASLRLRGPISTTSPADLKRKHETRIIDENLPNFVSPLERFTFIPDIDLPSEGIDDVARVYLLKVLTDIEPYVEPYWEVSEEWLALASAYNSDDKTGMMKRIGRFTRVFFTQDTSKLGVSEEAVRVRLQ